MSFSLGQIHMHTVKRSLRYSVLERLKQFTWIMYGHCKTSKVIFEVFHTRKKWNSSHESMYGHCKISKVIFEVFHTRKNEAVHMNHVRPLQNQQLIEALPTANVCLSFNTLLVPHKLLVIVHPICPNLNCWQYQSDSNAQWATVN